jgi:predicted amidohydrolase YtcJ
LALALALPSHAAPREVCSTPWGTAESIGIRDALKSYTIWAARQLFLETQIGSLEEGKYADIAVWDCDPYTASIDRLKDMGCQLTVFNGRIVYLREGTRITLSRQADSARTRP